MHSWSQIARRIRVPLGFSFVAVYFWLAQPTLHSISVGALIAVAGLGIRTLASGHVQKNEQLTMSGPYAYVRNPLYFGSVVLAVGLGSLPATGGSPLASSLCLWRSTSL